MRFVIFSLIILITVTFVKPVLAYEVAKTDFKVLCKTTNRAIPVYAYFPKVTAKKQQFPLVLHFHGYSGTGNGSTRLNTAIAAAGYVVLSPSMVDYYEGEQINGKLGQMIGNGTVHQALEPFINGRDFNHKSTGGTQRIQEARWLLDYFTNPSNTIPTAIKGLYNPKNAAISGHSFGGYTALGVAGIAEHTSAKNLKAILLYSPGVSMWDPDDYKDVTVPMMIQWGDSELRKQKESLDCYENCSGPSYMAILKNTGHFAWSDQLFGYKGRAAKVDSEAIFKTITRLSLDFFDGYLKNDKAALNRLSSEQGGLTRYDYRR